MKIGVISDTHLSKPTPELFRLQHGIFAGVSMILHAGDLTELAVLEAFSDKQVIAVGGNMDSPAVRNQLPSKRVVEVSGFRVGLTHYLKRPVGIFKGLAGEFEAVDAIVYGHTHRADNKVRKGVLFFNPGAFSGGCPFQGRCSVGILTLDKEIVGEIIKF